MAVTNAVVRDKLLAKLGVSKQRLSQLVNARKRELPMGTSQAVYTIAHDNGIDISKYLSQEETTEVRTLVAERRRSDSDTPTPASRATKRARALGRPADVKITIAGVDIGKIPALSRAHANDVKRMSERVYPLLYIFENSVRDLVERVLKDAHGKDWWTVVVPRTVQETAEKHKATEAKDSWHGQRGKREIDYVFLNDLWAIIKHKWTDFKALFPNQSWVETLITNDMNVSRRVFAHMNPLHENDVKNIEAAFRKWTNQLKGIEGKLP